VDLKNKPRDLLELNPYAKVPVLVDGDAVVYESAVIYEYLEEKYPSTPLLPRDPLQRAQVRIWIDFFNTRVHPAAHDIVHEQNPEKARAAMEKHLQTLDHAILGKKFLVGDYSLADITFIPFYTRRERYRVSLGGNLPNLKRWGEQLLARPAVAQTL
jgi:glutathione S-transferase